MKSYVLRWYSGIRSLQIKQWVLLRRISFLSRVNDDLNNIQDYIVNDAARAKICGLKKRIKKEIDIKHQNKIFETYFDEANEEFFKRLKEKYPDLTPYDLKIMRIYQDEYFRPRKSLQF